MTAVKEDDRAETFLERLIEEALDGVRACSSSNDAARATLRELSVSEADIDRMIAEAEADRLPIPNI